MTTISAPNAVAPKDDSPKVPFTPGEYVPNADGKVTLTVSFPITAVENPTFRPVEGLVALARNAGLKGYGPGDEPLATVGVQRAKIKGGGENPDAGKPTGTISLVLHTEESLTAARQRGRHGMSDGAKLAVSEASKLIKSALAKPGNDDAVVEISARASRGEIDLATALREMAALVG